jgi:hypothetical protein
MHSTTLRGIAVQLRQLAQARGEMADACEVRAEKLTTPYLVALEEAHARAYAATASSYLAQALEYDRAAEQAYRGERVRRVAARAPKREARAA